jgi:hypothetical protein
MRKRWTRWSVLGQQITDGAGAPVGEVVDTFPFDGGEVEMVVVRLGGTFAGQRMLAVEDLWFDGFGLTTPFARWQVEDSPALTGGRHAADEPYRARSHWRFEEPATFYAAA